MTRLQRALLIGALVGLLLACGARSEGAYHPPQAVATAAPTRASTSAPDNAVGFLWQKTPAAQTTKAVLTPTATPTLQPMAREPITIRQGQQGELDTTTVGVVSVRRGRYTLPGGEERTDTIAVIAVGGDTLTVGEGSEVVVEGGKRWRVIGVYDAGPAPMPGASQSGVRFAPL